ncbi:hypothetical protein Scep_016895 [Stephania cephalantha]|uniref:Uncharacterized protein n=1 Tax=Stephania cephalantha TaxID=152367 RepID=A0AAP0IQG4_9MAGN
MIEILQTREKQGKIRKGYINGGIISPWCPMYVGEGQSRRQRRTTARASQAATAKGESLRGSDDRRRGLRRQRRRGLRRQRRQRVKASEPATVDGTTSANPTTIRNLNRSDDRGPNLWQTVQRFQGLGERFR